MSIFVDTDTRLVVQGITGKEGQLIAGFGDSLQRSQELKVYLSGFCDGIHSSIGREQLDTITTGASTQTDGRSWSSGSTDRHRLVLTRIEGQLIDRFR